MCVDCPRTAQRVHSADTQVVIAIIRTYVSQVPSVASAPSDGRLAVDLASNCGPLHSLAKKIMNDMDPKRGASRAEEAIHDTAHRTCSDRGQGKSYRFAISVFFPEAGSTGDLRSNNSDAS